MTADLASLERLLARTALRVRLARGLAWGCAACAAAAAGAGTWLLLEPSARWTLAALAPISALSFVVGCCLRVRRELVSAAIDSAGALDGRVRAADEFMGLAPRERTPFVLAALRDAAARARDVRPAQAVPLRRPRAAVPALLSLLVCALISVRPAAPAPRPTPVARGVPERPLRLLASDELTARSESARSLAARTTSTDLLRQLADYLALLARLEAGTVPQETALQQALALESSLRSASEQPRAERRADADRRESASAEVDLRQLATELARARPELAGALQSGAFTEAARLLRALAEQTADGALEATQRARLLAALQKARERERERVAEQQREQALERSLLQNAREPSEPSLLKRHNEQQRELDTLRRKQATRPKRVLERLQRELARLGNALADDDATEAQDALERAADALDQHGRAQHDQATRDELARELAQLREELQQRALAEGSERELPQPGQSRRERPEGRTSQHAGGDPDARRERQLRFDLEARGQGGAALDGGGAALDGGSGSRLARGGQGGAPSQLLLIDEPVRSVVVAREVPAESGSAEHDARELDAPTRRGGRYEDRSLHGASAAGPSRSQVIRSAAHGGFASAPYRKVYADYRAHEEAVLEHEGVPAGYRYHVRRYFELVRPRAGQDGHR